MNKVFLEVALEDWGWEDGISGGGAAFDNTWTWESMGCILSAQKEQSLLMIILGTYRGVVRY